jgi:hypothetical protein
MLADQLDSQLDSAHDHTFEIAKLMSGLASIPFSQYGSIYYKEDLDTQLQSRPLYAEGEPQDECSERFRIGPSVERRFYRSERARMCIDRGPCEVVLLPIISLIDIRRRDRYPFLY